MSTLLKKYLFDIPREADGAGGAGGGDGGAAGGGQAGGQQTPWYQGKIEADLIGHAQNSGWKLDDPVALAAEALKAHREARKFIGVPESQILRLPKDATDEAGWKGVYSRLGVPAEAKEYDLSGVKLGDGKDLDPAFADAMRGALHSAKVSKDNASSVVSAVVKFMEGTKAAEVENRTAQVSASRAELQKSWGAKFDQNKAIATLGAQRLGVTPEDVASLENTIGYAKVMEMFRRVGVSTSEDTFQDGGGSGGPATSEAAGARLEELKTDKDFQKRLLSGDKAAEREFENLHRIKLGISDAA